MPAIAATTYPRGFRRQSSTPPNVSAVARIEISSAATNLNASGSIGTRSPRVEPREVRTRAVTSNGTAATSVIHSLPSHVALIHAAYRVPSVKQQAKRGLHHHQGCKCSRQHIRRFHLLQCRGNILNPLLTEEP